MSELLEAALRYASRGWPVFPCNGKRPIVANGFHDATTDRATIESWWRQWPDANVAVPTGRPSGLVVLDVDGDEGYDSLHELEREHGGLPHTASVTTPRGGQHFYFSHPGGEVPSSAGQLAPGLDIRADGGYAIAPPSIGYTPDEQAPLAGPPAWLMERLHRGRRNGAAPAVGAEIPAGKRNATLTSLAGTMRRRGFGEAAIMAALAATNKESCKPPLPDSELEGIAASVVRYEPSGVPTTDSGDSGENDQKASDPEVARLVPFSQIVSRPTRWVEPDRIALGTFTALSGRPKIGKGLFYCDRAAKVSTGTLAGDLDGPRDVVIVTTEDRPGEDLKPRLQAAGADMDRVHLLQMGPVEAPTPFRVPQDADKLARLLEQSQAALVIVDPLVEFVDGKVDSHKSHPVRQALAALRQVAHDHDCAILVVFHLNKGVSTDPLMRHEGSAAFTQIVRGGLMLGHDPDDPEGEDGRQRVLAVSMSNLAAKAPSLRYRIDTATVDGDTGEEIRTARMTCIGESPAGAHDLLRSTTEEQRTVTDEAVEFLREELADGPRLASEIKSEARKLGLSDMALFRGRQALGVKASKTGFRGGWEWVLHEDFKAPDAGVKSSEMKSSEKPSADAGLRLMEAPKISSPLNVKSSGPRCSCFRPGERLSDGRCGRCFGTYPEGWS